MTFLVAKFITPLRAHDTGLAKARNVPSRDMSAPRHREACRRPCSALCGLSSYVMLLVKDLPFKRHPFPAYKTRQSAAARSRRRDDDDDAIEVVLV
jgi:hypothetical protein